MDETLKRLCAKHDLTGIGANVFSFDTKPDIGVYLHWVTDGERDCTSGSGSTFDIALERALAAMAERRPRATPKVPVGSA